MKCEVCIKELVLGYVDPKKDFKLCAKCPFCNSNHMYVNRDKK